MQNPSQPAFQQRDFSPGASFSPYPEAQAEPQEALPSPKKRRAGVIVSLSLVGVLLIGLAASFALSAGGTEKLPSAQKPEQSNSSSGVPANHSDSAKVELPVTPKPEVEPRYQEASGRYTPEGIAQIMAPAVVGITTYAYGQTLSYQSMGSGFIVSADENTAYVVSNAHVFTDAERQKVTLSDGSEYEAVMVGSDVRSDLAVIRFTPKPGSEIVTAELGDSSQLVQGEQVMTVGSPGGFIGSTSVGYVSSSGRKLKVDYEGLTMDFIQTDAAISPGNSGGPLVNMYGQVVGVISWKYKPNSDDAMYEGLGFAISINQARPIVEDLISKGFVSGRPRLGITFTPITQSLSISYDLPIGLLIAEIDSSCDIANTELQPGDVITSIEGTPVYDGASAKEAISEKKAGDMVTAHVFRRTITNEESEFDITFRLSEEKQS